MNDVRRRAMPGARTMLVGAIAVLCSTGAVSRVRLLPATSTVCTLAPFGRMKVDGSPYFIGTALKDTTLAGAGATEYVTAAGHFGPRGVRTIYGQVVVVERVGGSAVPSGVLSSDKVLVVPWDYDPSCQTALWTKSAVWVTPGVRRFFTPLLRAREYWVGALPTFDAFAPQFDAYPTEYLESVFREGRESLTVDELFDLLDRLPTAAQVENQAWGALAPVGQWLDAHPEMGHRYPAEHITLEYSSRADDARARAITPRFGGTYRMTVTLPEGEPRRFFLRTAARPARAWHPVLSGGWREGTPHPWKSWAEGYELEFWTAPAESELPKLWDREDHDQPFPSEIQVVWDETRGRTDRRWHAEMDPDRLNDIFADDWPLRSFGPLIRMWQYKHRDDKGPPLTLGHFTLAGDGTARFVQRIPLADSTEIVLNGVRISPVTVSAVP